MFRSCYERDNDINNTFTAENMDVDMNIDVINNQKMPTPMMGPVQSPIIEPVQERIVNRTILHEVPHVCPIRTRIVNHHVFKHTYQPSYSCCEENVCSEVQENSCCNFR